MVVFHQIEKIQFINDYLLLDVDGKKYIDFAGGIGVMNGGHCPKPVVDAIVRQSRQLIRRNQARGRKAICCR